jgi:hypothetical protein
MKYDRVTLFICGELIRRDMFWICGSSLFWSITEISNITNIWSYIWQICYPGKFRWHWWGPERSVKYMQRLYEDNHLCQWNLSLHVIRCQKCCNMTSFSTLRSSNNQWNTWESIFFKCRFTIFVLTPRNKKSIFEFILGSNKSAP